MAKKPSVFIIESLNFEDEANGDSEGEILCKVLKLSSATVRYVYLRTRQELQEVLKQFKRSGYEYLHLSCHGNSKWIELTLDNVTFRDLGKILSPYIKDRRVFFSSCDVAHRELARALFNGSRCRSLIGPSKDIDFDQSAVFWAAFYHLAMRSGRLPARDRLMEITFTLQRVFGVRMRCFEHADTPAGFQEVDSKLWEGHASAPSRRR